MSNSSKKKLNSKRTDLSQDALMNSLQTVKENPTLVTQWAQKNPWKATTMTGLAIGSYLSYSQHVGEYQVPALTFKLSEQTTLSVEGNLGLEGNVKNLGVTFQWKF